MKRPVPHRAPTSVRCPHCQAEVPIEITDVPCSWWGRWRFSILGAGIVLLIGLGLGFRYRGQLQSLVLLANEVTGSTTLSTAALAVALLVALGAAGWLLLPWLIAWAYLDLRGRLRPGNDFHRQDKWR